MTYSLILRRTLLAAGAAALCLPAMAELADIKSAGKLRVGIDFGAAVGDAGGGVWCLAGASRLAQQRQSRFEWHCVGNAAPAQCLHAAIKKLGLLPGPELF